MNFRKKNGELKRLSKKHDRKHQFVLSKHHDHAGFFYFLLENQSSRQAVVIQEYLFEKFRNFIARLAQDEGKLSAKVFLLYKQKEKFSFSPESDGGEHVFLHELAPKAPSTGFLSLSRASLHTLGQLLFSPDLGEAHGLLSRIVAYHKLFQFTFVDHQESMNSDLAARKDLLSHVSPYFPRQDKTIDEAKIKESPGTKEKPGKGAASKGAVGDPKSAKLAKEFDSKLGARSNSSPFEVNYQALLQAKAFDGKSPNKVEETVGEDKEIYQYPLSLTASTLKKFDGKAFECEFNPDEIAHLRKNFLQVQDSEFYLGFEMAQAIYKKGKKYQAYTFPLYYMKVKITQANRMLQIHPTEGGRHYLNHIALANLVEHFSKSSSKDASEQFFTNLLQQRMEIQGKENRVYISRTLPVSEEYFSMNRSVLFGDAGSDGKTGLLSSLDLIGLECHVEDVYLYRVKKHLSVLSQALENDLEQIQSLAATEGLRFGKSLLGTFLLGEASTQASEAKKTESAMAWMPGVLPSSMVNLRRQLKLHDLVVLEGPPGTGKTHTIRNLLLDALCSGKRLMVVSDRPAAIEALVDKLQEYFLGLGQNENQSKELAKLWPGCIPCIEALPEDGFQLLSLLEGLKKQIQLDRDLNGNDLDVESDDFEGDLVGIEKKWRGCLADLETIMVGQMKPNPKNLHGSSGRAGQVSSSDDIEAILEYADFLDAKHESPYIKGTMSGEELAERFILQRNWLAEEEHRAFYRFFTLGELQDTGAYQIEDLKKSCVTLSTIKPKTCDELIDCLEPLGHDYLTKTFADILNRIQDPEISGLKKVMVLAKNQIKYPLHDLVLALGEQIDRYVMLNSVIQNLDDKVQAALQSIHVALESDAANAEAEKKVFPLALEFSLFKVAERKKLRRKEPEAYRRSPMEVLLELKGLQDRKDELVAAKVIKSLRSIALGLNQTADGDRTPLKTKLKYLCEQIGAAPNLEAASDSLTSLQEGLWAAYPIWVCRKQVVPFIMPCEENKIDLIIVDEATQCKVEDSLPLLMRAKKLMVVGDERQTVLAKNSSLDDYLFLEFNLKEHLAAAQATSVKGGGSHIFGLLKDIQHASVLLDEHYRCPPDIIAYSNRYVYNDQLRIMQWVKEGAKPAVYVDYGEKKAKQKPKPNSGPFKGLDVAMIDRFLSYIEKQVLEIEKERGYPVNVETELAICYFLLKNNAYFDDVKAKFLARLNRGQGILSGAGAALQGKERAYIFYFWDCYKGNFAAFRQGDDEHKRKGELNVLMSRPKVAAYHYLHHDFEDLNQAKSSITDYLWKSYHLGLEQQETAKSVKRKTPPNKQHAQNRASGQLITALIDRLYSKSTLEGDCPALGKQFHQQYSVEVGNPKYLVDLILTAKKQAPGTKSLALKDISCFAPSAAGVEDLVDYFFQLQRAQPGLRPYFCFLHDLLSSELSVRDLLDPHLPK